MYKKITITLFVVLAGAGAARAQSSGGFGFGAASAVRTDLSSNPQASVTLGSYGGGRYAALGALGDERGDEMPAHFYVLDAGLRGYVGHGYDSQSSRFLFTLRGTGYATAGLQINYVVPLAVSIEDLDFEYSTRGSRYSGLLGLTYHLPINLLLGSGYPDDPIVLLSFTSGLRGSSDLPNEVSVFAIAPKLRVASETIDLDALAIVVIDDNFHELTGSLGVTFKKPFDWGEVRVGLWLRGGYFRDVVADSERGSAEAMLMVGASI